MRIAVLSGKGGTGKTFVSVNLAYVAPKTLYIDCDVEEPNGWLFLKPLLEREEKVGVMVPSVNAEICNGCRKCVDFCKYNALAYVKDKLLIFSEICHSCGGCVILCPEKALTEKERGIGRIDYAKAGSVRTRTGILNTGEATGIPIIKRLLKDISEGETVVIDCPPGSSCVVMESIKDSDFCILVAEPTRFSVHNLAMVYELVKHFHKPHGVILNKTLEGETIAEDFCRAKGIPVLARIPYDVNIGLLNSQGAIVAENSIFRTLFENVWVEIQKEVEVQDEAVSHFKW